MATAQDTRERQGFSSSTTAPPGDGTSEQFSNAQMSDGTPDQSSNGQIYDNRSGDPNGNEPGTANYRPGQADASASSAGDAGGNGADAAGANAGSSNAGPSDGANDAQSASGSDTSGATGGDTGDGNTAGGATAANTGDAGGSGDDSGGLGGLISDAVADTQSLGSQVIGNAQSGGGTLINDVVSGTEQLVGNATDNLGLGNGGLLGGATGGLVPDATADTQTLVGNALNNADTGVGGIANGLVADAGNLVDHAAGNLSLGDGIVGDLTGGLPGGGLVGGVTDGVGNGIDLGNVLGDGPALTAGVLGDGNGAITQPVSDLTGGATDGVLGSPNGDGPIIDVGVVGSGSPAATGLLNDTGDGTLGGLGLGRIAEVNGAGDGNGEQDLSGTVGNEPGESGPIVNAQAFGSGNPPSNNLIDLGAGPNGENSGVIANVAGGSPDGSNPQTDANLIDTGPNGQTVANGNVLTSPDQFQFPVLDGAGTDALAGVLGGPDGTGPSLVPDAGVPAVDVGTNPIVDVDLAGNADAGQTQNPLQTALSGQLLGAA